MRYRNLYNKMARILFRTNLDGESTQEVACQSRRTTPAPPTHPALIQDLLHSYNESRRGYEDH